MVDLAFQQAAGKVAAKAHQAVRALIKPGVNALEIEQLVADIISQAKMKPAFKGYKDYPAVTCISINSDVVHGIPTDTVLKNGDIVSVDLGVSNQGWIVDTAWTYPVGTISPQHQKLLDTTEIALEEAIKLCKPGVTTGDLGAVIQKTVEANGFYIIRELTGHGVGKQLQEYPSIPNFGHPGKGVKLIEGMSIAIEPITALEPITVEIVDDNWTISAEPPVASAHFEHTVYIDSQGPIILTKQ